MKLSVGAIFSPSKKLPKTNSKKKSHSISRSTEAASFGSNTTITTAAHSSSEDSITSSYSSSSSSTQRCTTPKSVLPPTPQQRSASNKSLPGGCHVYWSSPSDCSTAASQPSAAELFNIFDQDGDGKITKRELEAVLGRLGPDPPTEEEVDTMLAEVDRDGDGCITLEEFEALGAAFGPPAGAELHDAFAVFDADGDGKISAEELLGVFAALGDMSCTLEECRRMIGGVDTDGDGFVCFDDFVRMMDGQKW